MSVLAWLGLPLLATVIATVWVHWVNRPRGPQKPADSMAAYERFCAAMNAPLHHDDAS